ncbi:MAG: LysM peptidoglycan-binding domain-containing protein [Anaerolineales bacterium]|nr:LysM peptidoglycan-binding domain-containing protein [Anaerolineales bacterium]
MKTLLRSALLLMVMLALAWPVGGASAAPLAADGPNLLLNPGFESPYGKQCCQADLSKYFPNTPIDEVQVAQHWSGWWLQPDQDPQHPGACQNCTAWHRPEWREANCGPVCANRIRSGNNAQKYFTFFSVHDAGMYQQVSGITPGQLLRFSVFMQGWSTNADYGLSAGQGTMGMRVGIDPFGGANAFSPNVIWSPVNDTYDAWGLYVIEAVAKGGTVTVFTRSTPQWGLQHNDIYVDDASLVVVGGGATSGGTTTGGATNNPAPAPTAVPTQVPGFSYVVQPGDNYYRIARRFGVSVQAILSANHVANPNLLYAGTVLIIPGVSGPAVTPAPTPDNTPPSGATSYTVVAGDNLFRLARRFNTTVARIKQLNGLTSDIIYIGQVLIIAP